MNAHTAWLWPDHAIGKSESRRLREEHNALLNSHAELLEALRDMLEWTERGDAAIDPPTDAARAAIAKATEE